MFPRIRYSLIAAFESGSILNKYSAAALTHCAPTSAARILRLMHRVDASIRICGWLPQQGSYVPIYKIVDGRADVQQPQIQTGNRTEYQRKRREEAEVR